MPDRSENLENSAWGTMWATSNPTNIRQNTFFDLNQEGSFTSLRGSKGVLLGVPGRSFYEVLRFFQKKFFFDDQIFFSADRIFEKSENL